jgi:hypothetical protein
MNQVRIFSVIGFLVATMGMAVAGTGQDAKKPGRTSFSPQEQKVKAIIRAAIAKDLQKHSVVLPDFGSSMEAVAAAVDSKKLIGLGESTHGTAECFQIKGSIILALAKKHKVRVLMEEQPICIAPLNEWVAGKAPYTDLLISGFAPPKPGGFRAGVG